ncbi:MAG: hypothetical protein MJD61_05830 [Proteobacteria bacterium]|nr:hypothetical protein [Pseudomonadota bacterium]
MAQDSLAPAALRAARLLRAGATDRSSQELEGCRSALARAQQCLRLAADQLEARLRMEHSLLYRPTPDATVRAQWLQMGAAHREQLRSQLRGKYWAFEHHLAAVRACYAEVERARERLQLALADEQVIERRIQLQAAAERRAHEKRLEIEDDERALSGPQAPSLPALDS